MCEENNTCFTCIEPLFIHGMYHIVGAVHRFYESRRRLFNDQQPDRMEAANRTKRTPSGLLYESKCVAISKSYNTGKSALPDIYAQCPRASAYRSGKTQVPVL